MALAPAAGAHGPTGLGVTGRRDLWWASPLATFIVYAGFIVYGTWSALHPSGYAVEPYLSPFFSPHFKPAWLPAWFSPAFFVLWAPLGFRFTCYYYRKSYYRSFMADPPACAVEEHRSRRYRGETRFPWLLQNAHRFFAFAATLVLLVLWYDVVVAFRFPAPDGGHRFGVGAGTVVMFVNCVMLSGYTFGCHSLRHLVGGGVDCFSCARAGRLRYGLWSVATRFNERHMQWAWISLFTVALTDVYIRLVAAGTLPDARLF